MKKIITILKGFILLFLFPFLSCKKLIKVDPPINKVTAGVVFSNNKTASAAVFGIYTQMMVTLPVISSGGMTIYPGLSSDELYNTSTADPNIAEFTNNTLSAGNSILGSDFWLKGYNIIYQANACMEGLAASTSISDSLKNQLNGEVKFIRAFMYFNLVNLFGNVPLLTSTDYEKNSTTPRIDASLVYEQIINDLKVAKSLLLPAYPSAGPVRPNKWAATALLARVYLYRQQWALAEAEATEVIKSGSYLLNSNLNNVYLAGSSEAIWQLTPVSTGFNTTEARYLIPTSSATTLPDYPITNYLLNAFETGDQRKINWIKSKMVSTQTYYYPYKYKINALNAPVTEHYMVLRLAEQYLLRAECRAQLNNLTDSKTDLNIIRNRAGLPATTAITQPELLGAIMQERRVELFAEWGHRWFDLKRTGRADQVLSTIKTGWQSTDTLYPITNAELRLNPALIQNPGY